MTRKTKRIATLALSVFLVLTMCVCIAPMFAVNANAAATLVTEENYETLGLGKEYIDYYAIGSADDLFAFAEIVNGGDNDANAVLTADIVMPEGKQWTPIVDDDYVYYYGTFDGNGKTISGLYFNDSNKSYVGLVGTNSGTVKNLGLLNVNITAESSIGGVAGWNGGIVTNCYVTGNLSGGYVGGVIGWNGNGGQVTNCYSTATVNSEDYAGGVVGRNYCAIMNCYSTGSVSGEYAGGVAGENARGASITNSYAYGNVSGTTNVGGVVGITRSTVTNCYFLQTDEVNASLAGIGKDDSSDASANKAFSANADLFASGFVAYELQGEQDTHVWGQKLGAENYPVLGGLKVQLDASGVYHNYDNGICAAHDNCYEVATTVGEGNALYETHKDYYIIDNAGKLYWFAAAG